MNQYQPELGSYTPSPKPAIKRLPLPTLEECRFHAACIGLPESEADKFFHFYSSKNWFVGKTRMVLWHGAMAGWKLRYEERVREKAAREQQRVAEPSRNVQLIGWRDELRRVEDAMKNVKGAHWFDGRWDGDKWRVEYNRLANRKCELVKLLGMAI